MLQPKKKSRAEELDSNPNRLPNETLENYKHRQLYNEFRIRQRQDKNIVKKLYNEMNDDQNKDKNFFTRNTRKIITSPVHLASYLDDKLNLNDTNKFRSNDQYVKDNIKGINSLIDATSLLFPYMRSAYL